MEAKEVRSLQEAYASIYEGYGKEKNEKSEKGKKECVDKEDKGKHNCAKKVCHEQFGKGTCIFGEHAAPDENGVVNFYDVLFEHGVEKNVPLIELEVLEEGSHNEDYHRYAGEQLDEMVPALQEPVKKALDAGAKFMNTNPVGKAIKKVLAPAGPGRGTVTKADQDKKIQQNNSADLFDIVKGHLMSEGYADTEEAALAIMANMSEEWRQSIVEETRKYAKNVVLAKRGGVEGIMNKKTGHFVKQEGGWDHTDAARYRREGGDVSLINRRNPPENRIK